MYENRDKMTEFFKEYDEENQIQVNSGIELNRKGRAAIKVVDIEGNPVEGAEVSAKLINHEFKHGANIFMIDELETEEKNEAYKNLFKQAFNLATIPFYWQDLEPEQGRPRFAADSPKIYRRPAPDLCMNYCRENGIEPKLHCLNYDHFIPDWYRNKTVTEQKKLLEKRMREIGERYADIIPGIEVTNETWWNLKRDKGASAFYNEDDFVKWSFDTARKYFPNNELIINEGTGEWGWDGKCLNRQAYFMQIERELRAGTRIDTIGLQYHLFWKKEAVYNETRYLLNPEWMNRSMDQYAKLGLPIQVTEITIPAYSSEVEDVEMQAEIIDKLYRMWFAHPSVEAIIYWNLVDGYAYNAIPGDMTAGENYFYGGLINFDMTEKSSFKVIKDLFNKEWVTNETFGSDTLGKADFRGFYGEYEITVKKGHDHKTQKIKFSKKGPDTFIFEL